MVDLEPTVVDEVRTGTYRQLFHPEQLITGELTDAVEDKIHNLFANSIVATCKVVGRILLASDQLLWVEELAVCAGAYLIDNSGLQINHNATRRMLASTCL